MRDKFGGCGQDTCASLFDFYFWLREAILVVRCMALHTSCSHCSLSSKPRLLVPELFIFRGAGVRMCFEACQTDDQRYSEGKALGTTFMHACMQTRSSPQRFGPAEDQFDLQNARCAHDFDREHSV